MRCCFFSLQGASPRWEPQIATLCEAGQQYHPQHLSEDGRWTTDLSIKTPATTCLRDKMDLLEHCKKVRKDPIHTLIKHPSSFIFILSVCLINAINHGEGSLDWLFLMYKLRIMMRERQWWFHYFTTTWHLGMMCVCYIHCVQYSQIV